MFTPVPLELIYHDPERVGGAFAIVVYKFYFVIELRYKMYHN